jgi:hypothetical protein
MRMSLEDIFLSLTTDESQAADTASVPDTSAEPAQEDAPNA